MTALTTSGSVAEGLCSSLQLKNEGTVRVLYRPLYGKSHYLMQSRDYRILHGLRYSITVTMLRTGRACGRCGRRDGPERWHERPPTKIKDQVRRPKINLVALALARVADRDVLRLGLRLLRSKIKDQVQRSKISSHHSRAQHGRRHRATDAMGSWKTVECCSLFDSFYGYRIQVDMIH